MYTGMILVFCPCRRICILTTSLQSHLSLIVPLEMKRLFRNVSSRYVGALPVEPGLPHVLVVHVPGDDQCDDAPLTNQLPVSLRSSTNLSLDWSCANSSVFSCQTTVLIGVATGDSSGWKGKCRRPQSSLVSLNSFLYPGQTHKISSF